MFAAANSNVDLVTEGRFWLAHQPGLGHLLLLLRFCIVRGGWAGAYDEEDLEGALRAAGVGTSSSSINTGGAFSLAGDGSPRGVAARVPSAPIPPVLQGMGSAAAGAALGFQVAGARVVVGSGGAGGSARDRSLSSEGAEESNAEDFATLQVYTRGAIPTVRAVARSALTLLVISLDKVSRLHAGVPLSAKSVAFIRSSLRAVIGDAGARRAHELEVRSVDGAMEVGAPVGRSLSGGTSFSATSAARSGFGSAYAGAGSVGSGGGWGGGGGPADSAWVEEFWRRTVRLGRVLGSPREAIRLVHYVHEALECRSDPTRLSAQDDHGEAAGTTGGDSGASANTASPVRRPGLGRSATAWGASTSSAAGTGLDSPRSSWMAPTLGRGAVKPGAGDPAGRVFPSGGSRW